MDFKKAYEDAIERAKGIYNENPSSSTAKFVCGQIFPELIESEDERIRKDLICEVQSWERIPQSKREKYIAYLEKQNAEFIEYGRQEYLRGRTEAIDEQKPQLTEGVYYIKNGQPVAEYEDGVETDRLLVVGKYCRFYLSMTDLGIANYKEAQNKAASLGEGWRCPDSFEGRTIGKMSKEIREKAAKIGAEHFKEKGWFWTNELFYRWDACDVGFDDGRVRGSDVTYVSYVLALSVFQN